MAELSGDLRRLSHQLHPARLEYVGLASAIRGFCEEMESAHAVKIEFVETTLPATLSEATSLNIYRIVQEALQNVVKHSGASEASVILSTNDNELQLTISDTGRGFDPGIAAPDGSGSGSCTEVSQSIPVPIAAHGLKPLYLCRSRLPCHFSPNLSFWLS
jgi:signal transduction histidine kinase